MQNFAVELKYISHFIEIVPMTWGSKRIYDCFATHLTVLDRVHGIVWKSVGTKEVMHRQI